MPGGRPERASQPRGAWGSPGTGVSVTATPRPSNAGAVTAASCALSLRTVVLAVDDEHPRQRVRVAVHHSV